MWAYFASYSITPAPSTLPKHIESTQVFILRINKFAIPKGATLCHMAGIFP